MSWTGDKPVKIESIKRLDIKPGEVLVIKAHRSLTMDDVERIKAKAKALLPEGIEVLVHDENLELSVVSTNDAEFEDRVVRAMRNAQRRGRTG